MVCPFLEKHKVKKLEFLCITHSHGDHNGDTISVLEKFKVGLLIMKEFDLKWSPGGTQKTYENIVLKAIEKNIKILGISFESLGSEEYSPSRSDNFKKGIQNAKKENFEYFNEKNISFEFGSADIKIMNWEIFDSEGNLFVTGQNEKNGKKVYRDIYKGENENSLGILLFQGNKKAFFSGDMGNIKKNIKGKQIGDEDRLKNEIGKIDFLKFGHHGYASSNTQDYLNVISPNYGVITNDIGISEASTYKYIEKNIYNFLYSTQDEYEVCSIIYNDQVTLGFGTPGIKKINDELFYISESHIYSDYLKCKITIKYDLVEKTVNNWDELKTIIEQYKNSEVSVKDNCYIGKCLKIYLNNENNKNIYIANSSIIINNYQNIHLISKKNEITIKRDETLVKYPLFKIENGSLTLGEEKMEGKIIIDGNKDKVISTSHLIQIMNSELTIYNNVILCNNYYKITKRPSKYLDFGSAILATSYSKINMYGGEISNNIQELFIDKTMKSEILPEKMAKTYTYDVKGIAIYLRSSTLNIYGGKICNNKGINNSEIYSNENSTKSGYSLNQRCLGIIFSEYFSKIYLHKGIISDNTMINNAKTNLITPKGEKITNITDLNSCIYGSALFCKNSKIEIYKDFTFSNNSSNLKTTINIEKNCIVNGGINSAIRGGQIYLNSTKVKIGGIIENSNNSKKINSSIAPNEEGKINNISNITLGGAIGFIQCQDIEINNLKINKCNGGYGGAIYFNSSSKGKISYSEFTYNSAKIGGAIFMASSCSFVINNTKFSNNSSTEGAGGGIYADGVLTIEGEKSYISNNVADSYGGGIFAKNKITINNGIINNNKAMKNSGGGIHLSGKGELILKKAKIFKNWCKQYGGGINYSNAKSFIYDKNEIDKMVYSNKAEKGGDNIFPLSNSK